MNGDQLKKENKLGALINMVENLQKEVKNNKVQIEKKISESYAGVCSKKRENDDLNSFRSILEETKMEQITEEQEIERRSTNLIIHGVDESSRMEDTKLKKIDEDFVSQLLNDINIEANPKYVNRIGTRYLGKRRPIKIVLHDAHTRYTIQKKIDALERQRKI